MDSEELAGQVVTSSGQEEEVEAGNVLEDVNMCLETLHAHHLPLPHNGETLSGAEHQGVLHPDYGENLVWWRQAGHHGPANRGVGLNWSQVGGGTLDNFLQLVHPVNFTGEVLAHEVERFLKLPHGVDGELEGVGPVGVVEVVNLAEGDTALERHSAVGESQTQLVDLLSLVLVSVHVQHCGPQHQEHVGPLAGHDALDLSLLKNV